MKHFNRLYLSAAAVVLVAAGLACSIPGVGGDTGVLVVTATPGAGSVGTAPPPTAPLDPASICPAPAEGTLSYVSTEAGFCLLYPADFEVNPTFSAGFVGGPVVGEVESFGALRPELVFGWVGPAGGQTPRQAAEGALSQADPATVWDIAVDGWPAVQYLYTAEPIPARSAYIVANDQVYTIVNQPYDPVRYPDAIPYLDRVWNVVTESITFFDIWR